MLNTPVQMVPQGYQQAQSVVPQYNLQQPNEVRKSACEEQSMAISYDIAAEYSAIGRMNNIIADVAKELKVEEDPVRKKLLEARINTLNSMILQREARINQMEQALNSLKSCACA
ncbi:hypothetical protein IKP85_03060 [bacterium]|nr:hypothetical protein [bacterium]